MKLFQYILILFNILWLNLILKFYFHPSSLKFNSIQTVEMKNGNKMENVPQPQVQSLSCRCCHCRWYLNVISEKELIFFGSFFFLNREISLEAHRMARTERLEDKDELVATEIGHGHIGNWESKRLVKLRTDRAAQSTTSPQWEWRDEWVAQISSSTPLPSLSVFV